ncbi:phosphatidylglycerophosphatase A [Acetobacteraceae bacterium H6797]|nr:phosphatidylglycerophosphatase A [Acetobacteraceae bacterium H6797]
MITARLVASLFGTGFLRPAPGTWGSLLVLPLAWLGWEACLALSFLLFLVGVWAVKASKAEEDPNWVVIDEGSGMLLALSVGAAHATVFFVLVAFAFFRVADILKPWPVSWADRKKGAFWVMFDDVLAGALAAAALLLLSHMGFFSR